MSGPSAAPPPSAQARDGTLPTAAPSPEIKGSMRDIATCGGGVAPRDSTRCSRPENASRNAATAQSIRSRSPAPDAALRMACSAWSAALARTCLHSGSPPNKPSSARMSESNPARPSTASSRFCARTPRRSPATRRAKRRRSHLPEGCLAHESQRRNTTLPRLHIHMRPFGLGPDRGLAYRPGAHELATSWPVRECPRFRTR